METAPSSHNDSPDTPAQLQAPPQVGSRIRQPPAAWVVPLGVFILTLGMALGMRWANLDLVEFKEDEAGNLRLAVLSWTQGTWATAGIGSSIGHLNVPLLIWILKPLTGISRRPEVAAGGMALLDALGSAALAAFMARRFGLGVGMVVGGLAATAPWQVFYSRKIWQQALVPAASCMALLPMIFLARDRPEENETSRTTEWSLFRAFLLSISALVILAALHPVSIAPGLVGLTFTIQQVWKNRWLMQRMSRQAILMQAALLGLGVLLVATPWVVWSVEDIRHHGAQSIFRLISGGQPQVHSEPSWSTLLTPLALAGGMGFFPSGFCGQLAAVAVLGLIAMGTFQGFQRGCPAGWVWGWIGSGPALAFLSGRPVYDHYFLATLPACWVVASWAWLPPRSRRMRRGQQLLTLMLLVTSMVGAVGSFQALTKELRRGAWSQTWAGYGVPLVRLRETFAPYRTGYAHQAMMALEDVARRKGLEPHPVLPAAGGVYLGAVQYLLTMDPPRTRDSSPFPSGSTFP
jgi:hypothetical protein